jgi:hypothetical protein
VAFFITENKNDMKRKIIKHLKENGETYLLDFLSIMPEIKGEFCIYMGTKKGLNNNVIWMVNVNKKFAKAFHELLSQGKIKWDVADLGLIILDQKRIIGSHSLVTKKIMKTQRECWMPINIYVEGYRK